MARRGTKGRPRAPFDVRTGDIILYDVQRMVREETPWEYERSHPAYHSRFPYTLLIYHSGFKQRIYDWEGRPKRLPGPAYSHLPLIPQAVPVSVHQALTG